MSRLTKVSGSLLAILMIAMTQLQVSGVAAVPIGLLSLDSAVIRASSNAALFILADPGPANLGVTNPRPPNVAYATLSDWTATGFVYGMCLNMPQVMVLDSSASYVDQSDGRLKVSQMPVVAFGGPAVHAVVNYYEKGRFTPLYFHYDQVAGQYQFRRSSDGTVVYGLLTSQVTENYDVLMVEAFTDSSGNTIFICYGIGFKGTYAMGKLLKSRIGPNISLYTYSWYIYIWRDLNGDGFPDLNEISADPVAYGS
jgi:hypothetical protein